MKEEVYVPFKSFVFRTPALSVNDFFQEILKLEQEESYWEQFLQNLLLQEAVFLASPILYDEVEKYLTGYLSKEKEIEKLKYAVLRYYSRMTSRCTPFGLFAGFSLGELAEETKIILPPLSKYHRFTRLDMHYLCALAQNIGKNEKIQHSIKYYPNTSLYKIGNKLRYVEYFYKKSRRIHNISSVDYSEYLDGIITFAQTGASFEELVLLIVEMLPEENISNEDAKSFISELINSQILVSDLEPEITGKNFLHQLLRVLKQIDYKADIYDNLTILDALLKKIDRQEPGKSIHLYKKAEEIIKTTETAYEKNYLFQVDMFKFISDATLNNKITEEILDAFTLMNLVTSPNKANLLEKFKEDFYEKYEEREIPLLEALDIENGIGYPANKGDISPLLEDYVFPDKETVQHKIGWNRIQSVLHKKLIDCYKTGSHSIEFTERDFNFLKPDWNDLPQTVFCMCEIFSSDDSKPNIYVHSVNGSSAANILGRFCHVSKELEEYVKEITQFESLHNPDIIYAEIVHLPESRIGNVLLRPILREYEIPYLAKSSTPPDCQISLSDLFVSIRHERIVLRSKRLNKEIVPRLSTAHNYFMNTMPVYHFLCDLQTQGLRSGVNFTWGHLSEEFDFLPRAVYKNTILSLAQWKVRTDDFRKLMEKQSDTESKSKIQQWRKERSIPRLVLITEGDNELLIDFENILTIKMLFSIIKKYPVFILTEFLFDMQNPVIKDGQGDSFTNEFIITFHKKNE